MAISVMLKPASSNCNLSCKYCFYHSLSSERSNYSMGMMSSDTAESVIKSAFDFAEGSDVYFTFQGGEPLLRGLDFYLDFVECIKKYNSRNSAVHLCLQTNATLINDKFAEFFKRNNFLIGVSLDGDKELNSYRLYNDNSESFDDVMRGIDLLKKYGVSFNVLSVLTKKTALNFRQAYRFFKAHDLRYMQFIPCLKPFSGNYDEGMYMSVSDYSEFLRRGFNIYYNDFMRREPVSVRMFDNYVSLASGSNAEQCGMNGCCSTQFVVEGDGSVYPCDFYCTDEWYLGNINEASFKELYRSSKSVEFLKESFLLSDDCKKCRWFYICRGGGCKRNRQDSDYCAAYKAFFEAYEYKIKQMKG